MRAQIADTNLDLCGRMEGAQSLSPPSSPKKASLLLLLLLLVLLPEEEESTVKLEASKKATQERNMPC